MLRAILRNLMVYRDLQGRADDLGMADHGAPHRPRPRGENGGGRHRDHAGPGQPLNGIIHGDRLERGPRPIDLRRANQVGTNLYAELLEHSRQFGAVAGEGWQDVLAYANRCILPQLTTEEAALQFVCHQLAYYHPRLDDSITLNIHRGYVDYEFRHRQGFGNDHQAHISYASNYVTDATHACDDHGVVAWRLRPVGAQASHHASLVVFRGTRPRGNNVARGTEHFRTGLADDFDIDGIGRRGFRVNGRLLRAWCEELLGHHRLLVICGHSLGGAYAARTLASLPANLQKRTRLVSFNAPGIDRAAARAILPYNDNVRLIRHADDVVHQAGECHPRGSVIVQKGRDWEPGGIFMPHSMDTLVRGELNGTAIIYTLHADDAGEQPQQIERARVQAGALLRGLLPG
jgi:pimeloyl-ACP methyl ester carboxylesterase